MAMPKKLIMLYHLVTDFMKKCSDDHVGAFGAMSAFFMVLSIFPFLILLLMLTRYLPFSKQDVINGIMMVLSFEKASIIVGIVNAIYRNAGTSVLTISLLTVLWSSSKGVYSIVLGLNSVYDIDETRNYIVLRIFSMFYTVIFLILIASTMVVWIFGKKLYYLIHEQFPWITPFIRPILENRISLSLICLITLFTIVYKFIPNRTSKILQQLPGAVIAAIGWIVISEWCSLIIGGFTNFSYLYGSMSWIMILLIWLYFSMSMIFYGAEINYFLENKHNYHTLIRILRPRYKEVRRKREKELKK